MKFLYLRSGDGEVAINTAKITHIEPALPYGNACPDEHLRGKPRVNVCFQGGGFTTVDGTVESVAQAVRFPAALKRVEGYVYCTRHGEVHEDSLDPYEYGPPANDDFDARCTPEDHVKVYARHK